MPPAGDGERAAEPRWQLSGAGNRRSKEGREGGKKEGAENVIVKCDDSEAEQRDVRVCASPTPPRLVSHIRVSSSQEKPLTAVAPVKPSSPDACQCLCACVLFVYGPLLPASSKVNSFRLNSPRRLLHRCKASSCNVDWMRGEERRPQQELMLPSN